MRRDEQQRIQAWLRDRKACAVARAVGVEPTTVYKWIRGDHCPRGGNLRRLRDTMETTQNPIRRLGGER